MDAKNIGRILRFHRKKAELSQEALAKIAGIGKTAVFDIEKGKLSVRFDTILKVLEVLNVKIDFQGPLMHLFKESLSENS